MEFLIHKWKYLKTTEILNVTVMFFSVLFFYLFSPFLSVLAALFFLSLVFESDKVRISILTFIFLSVYSMIIFFKPVSGDWNWYTQHYRALQSIDFLSYYGHTYGPFTIKYTEPVYYFLSFVLSRATGANVTALALVVSTIFYSVFTFSLFKLSKYFSIASWQKNIVVIAAVLLSVTPSLVLHLVRQEMASVLLFCGLVLLLTSNKRSAICFLIVSVFTHQSAAIVLGIFAFSYLLSRIPFGSSWFFAFVVSLLMGLFYVKSGYFISEDNAGKGDGTVNPLVYLYDAILLFSFLFSVYSIKLNPVVKSIFYIFVASYMGFLLGVSPEPLPLLRMYFYVEWFRAFFIVVVLSRMVSFIYFNALSVFILLLGGFYTNYRISSSDLGFPLSIYSFVNRSIQSWMFLF
ncbi:EpsG family protein [Iodobacter fluviatilis]|uniref:EpsG-like putative glucosyltransferase n=1 Tax=Iodobacter fluviatilis TaxID=537 RepID=A0A377SX19_9NEIS|nr:EpsG family protein [Iodobacter fluviatilis]TCU88032.1 EpsG-like putative glucosyltransferase [Iodobacter fluviatilis]STR45533.1 Uncharacterised protein [Iodobacter fluviatilis]